MIVWGRLMRLNRLRTIQSILMSERWNIPRDWAFWRRRGSVNQFPLQIANFFFISNTSCDWCDVSMECHPFTPCNRTSMVRWLISSIVLDLKLALLISPLRPQYYYISFNHELPKVQICFPTLPKRRPMGWVWEAPLKGYEPQLKEEIEWGESRLWLFCLLSQRLKWFTKK